MSANKGKQSAEIAAQSRQLILNAAGQLFAQKGFHAASLREIATSAGTTHGLIRHHFGTKEDLWRAVVDRFVDRIAAGQRPLLERAGKGDPIELLKDIATSYIREAAASPEISKLIIKDCSEPGSRLDYLVEKIVPMHQLITPVFEHVQAAGYLQEHDPDSFFIFLVMLGSFPMTMADFTNKFYKVDINTNEGIEGHIDRVMATLF